MRSFQYMDDNGMDGLVLISFGHWTRQIEVTNVNLPPTGMAVG